MIVKYIKGDSVRDKSGPTAALECDDGGLPIDPEPKLPGGKLAASSSEFRTKNIVSVYALDGDGNWQLLNTSYPRFQKTEFYTELGDYFVNDLLTVKLEWSGSLCIDYLPFQWFSDEPLTLERAELRSARHSVIGDVQNRLSTSDGDSVTLKPGESIDLEFSVQPAAPGEYVGLLLIANGRYETLQPDNMSATVVFDQNYPNPFNPSTTFSFSLRAEADVNLTVYNVLGQEVREVVNQHFFAGTHQIVWDGKDASGRDLATGVYLAKLTAGDAVATRKVTLLR